MGYTHYWASEIDFPEFIAAFPRLTFDAKRITTLLYTRGIDLANGLGDPLTTPEFNERLFRFNGLGDEAHETFVIDSKRGGWDFCKTNRKPYDVAVCAVLIRAAQLAPAAFVIASDGDWEHDWAEARHVVTELFGSDHITQGGPDGPLDVDTTAGPPCRAGAPR